MNKDYMIPENLSDFQRLMYMHLIDWKWKHITKNPGQYAGRYYDAVLPADYAKYHKVYFSVCHHPGNTALNDSMTAFRSLLGDKDKFSSFTSEPLIAADLEISDLEIKNWADWYSDLYLG